MNRPLRASASDDSAAARCCPTVAAAKARAEAKASTTARVVCAGSIASEAASRSMMIAVTIPAGRVITVG